MTHATPAEEGPKPGRSAGAYDSARRDRAHNEAERRRRRARVFGDVLPDETSDDRDDWGGRPDGGINRGTDEWLRRQVPPHHG